MLMTHGPTRREFLGSMVALTMVPDASRPRATATRIAATESTFPAGAVNAGLIGRTKALGAIPTRKTSKGSIEARKLADLVVSGRDPLHKSPSILITTPIARITVGGAGRLLKSMVFFDLVWSTLLLLCI